MENGVFETLLLVGITIVMICVVFLISLLIKYEVFTKFFILLYRRYIQNKDNNKKSTKKIAIRRIVLRQIRELKKDMKMQKKTSFSENEIDKVSEIKKFSKKKSTPDTQKQKNKFEYLINEIYINSEEEIK